LILQEKTFMDAAKHVAGKKAVSDKLGAAADKAGELVTTGKKVGLLTFKP